MIFFAVPHRGIDLEDMIRIVGEGRQPRNDLLKQISLNSLDLRTQLKDFKLQLRDRKVVSFFETLQSRRLKFVSLKHLK